MTQIGTLVQERRGEWLLYICCATLLLEARSRRTWPSGLVSTSRGNQIGGAWTRRRLEGCGTLTCEVSLVGLSAGLFRDGLLFLFLSAWWASELQKTPRLCLQLEGTEVVLPGYLWRGWRVEEGYLPIGCAQCEPSRVPSALHNIIRQ